MSDPSLHWNTLHSSARFRPAYPSEPVVRFLAASRGQLSTPAPKFLDIGAGAGRHLMLATELGFVSIGVDFSETGLVHARERLSDRNSPPLLSVASMTHLPFMDGCFDTALSYGVFYYGHTAQMRAAISELLRILKSGGRAFVVLRTTGDYRFGKGLQLEPHTFLLNISETNEQQCVMHFVSEENIPEYFGGFSQVRFEKTETTFGERSGTNSDWLITVEK